MHLQGISFLLQKNGFCLGYLCTKEHFECKKCDIKPFHIKYGIFKLLDFHFTTNVLKIVIVSLIDYRIITIKWRVWDIIYDEFNQNVFPPYSTSQNTARGIRGELSKSENRPGQKERRTDTSQTDGRQIRLRSHSHLSRLALRVCRR